MSVQSDLSIYVTTMDILYVYFHAFWCGNCTFEVAKKPKLKKLDIIWTRNGYRKLSLSHENHETIHIEITKNHRSDLIPCSNDLSWLPLWFKSFRRQPSNIMQHTSFVRFLRSRFPCSTPWQLSLTRFCNGLNRYGGITTCFLRVVSYRLANLLQQPI